MPRGKKFTAEQIIGKLREAEVELAQGKTVPEVVRKLGVTEQTYYRWKREYGGLRTDQAKRLKDLEKENARLKRLLADAELDKAILREAASVNRSNRRRSLPLAGRPPAGANSCRSTTTATSPRRHPTSCPRSTTTASDRCRTRGHDKTARRPDSERLRANGKKRRFRGEGGRSGNRFLGRGRPGRREQPAHESLSSRAMLAEVPLAGLSFDLRTTKRECGDGRCREEQEAAGVERDPETPVVGRES
jgi:putative transposase